MGRTISAQSVLNNEYHLVGVDEETTRLIGDVEVGFTMLIWGASGSGKTTFAIRNLATYLATNHGKVYFNSIEQGEGAGIQKVLQRCDLSAVPKGQFMFGDRDTFPEMVNKIKRINPRFIFIDSADYLNLTSTQYKQLRDVCHKGRKNSRKSLIIISWENNEQPKSQYMKDVRYMVDIKVYVRKGIVKADSRFGATDSFDVFRQAFVQSDARHQQQSIFTT